MNQNVDLNDCMANCSNNGICVYSTLQNKYLCQCFTYFSGSMCQIDLRPCSQNPCLNGGLCIQNGSSIVDLSYYCVCMQNYQGVRCELKTDICSNETCSNHGTCIDLFNTTKCKCYDLYEGEKCENESEYLKTINKVINSSLIIAIITIIIFYLIFIVSDLLVWKLKQKRKEKYIKNKNNIFKKFVYRS